MYVYVVSYYTSHQQVQAAAAAVVRAALVYPSDSESLIITAYTSSVCSTETFTNNAWSKMYGVYQIHKYIKTRKHPSFRNFPTETNR